MSILKVKNTTDFLELLNNLLITLENHFKTHLTNKSHLNTTISNAKYRDRYFTDNQKLFAKKYLKAESKPIEKKLEEYLKKSL